MAKETLAVALKLLFGDEGGLFEPGYCDKGGGPTKACSAKIAGSFNFVKGLSIWRQHNSNSMLSMPSALQPNLPKS